MYPRGLIDPPAEVEQPRSPLRLYEKGNWDPADRHWGVPDDAVEMCRALLWLNPADNQGASELLPEITAVAPWPQPAVAARRC